MLASRPGRVRPAASPVRRPASTPVGAAASTLVGAVASTLVGAAASTLVGAAASTVVSAAGAERLVRTAQATTPASAPAATRPATAATRRHRPGRPAVTTGAAATAGSVGAGAGLGYHHNYPLPYKTDDALYLATLDAALAKIRDFAPRWLVLSFGADIYAGDPIGDLAVTTPGIAAIGQRIASLELPTLIVMEGGYNTEQLGANTVNLLAGFA